MTPAQQLNENPLFRRLHKHAQKRLVFDPGVPRGKQLSAYKRFVELESEMLKRHHRQGDSGFKDCKARTAMVDVVLENLFIAALDMYCTQHGRLPCKMAILATGGYGRGELNPHSDIDIMFLYPDRISNRERFETFQEILTEEILYPLWDLGWKIGHASRNTREVLGEAKKEIQSKNAILEARIICGSEPLFTEMRRRFVSFCQRGNAKSYIKQRFIDEKERHNKAGNTIYLQEPDIKNGIGGLRDYQNILWIAHIKYGYDSLLDLEKAKILRRGQRVAMTRSYDFLLRARTELHLQNRRPTDKLSLEQQPAIAEGLGYLHVNIFARVEAFMKDYYTAARTIYNNCELLKERLSIYTGSRSGFAKSISFKNALRAHQHHRAKKIDGFILAEKTLTAENKHVFQKSPIRLIRVFQYMQQYGAAPDCNLKFLIADSISLIDHAIINSPSAAKSFCSILRSPGEVYAILLQMHELGVLGRYLPEFGQLTCMVQHEYYHRYTADMHVLRTIKHLDGVFLKETSIASSYERELRKNDDPLLLYLILLLHDIGKAEGVKGHDVAGVRIAKPILERLGIDTKQQEQILFIIRNHLEMARIWQRYDLEDPKTGASFANHVEDPEKLRFLYVHTYCDARGTAPTLWNSYKDSMHRILYTTTLDSFDGEDVIQRKREEHKAMLNRELLARTVQEGGSSEEVNAHFSLLPERYFINTKVEEISLHLRLISQLLGQINAAESVGALTPVIDWRNDDDLNMTVINVVTWDRAGLFYKLAGALTLAGVNIVSTKAISRSDHISIDTFYAIANGGGVVMDNEAENIFKAHLEDVLVRGKRLHKAIDELEKKDLQARKKNRALLPAPFPPSVDVYHELSLKRTIIEAQTSDRRGLLYRLARLIYERGFDITFARVATERGVAMDTFYIENANAQKPTSTSNLLDLRMDLDKIVREEI